MIRLYQHKENIIGIFDMTAAMNREQICRFVLENSKNVIGLVLTDMKEYSDLTIDEDNIKSAAFEEFMSKNSYEYAEYVFFDNMVEYHRFINSLLDATEEGKLSPFGVDFQIFTQFGLVHKIHT